MMMIARKGGERRKSVCLRSPGGGGERFKVLKKIGVCKEI